MTHIGSRFRVGFDDAAIGMSVARLDGRLLRVNDAYCTLVGHDAATLLGMGMDDVIHPDDLAPAADLVSTALDAGDAAVTVDARCLHASGATLHVRVSMAIIRDDDGAPEYFFAQVQDVTELVEAQRSAREGRERLERIIASATDAYMEIDDHGVVRAWNPAAESLLGWSSDEAVGQDVFEFLRPPGTDATAHRAALRRFRDGLGRLAETFEATMSARDGRTVPIEMTVWTLDEQSRSIHAFVHDITARRAQEEALRRSAAALVEAEQRWRLTLDNAPTGIALTEVDGRMVRVNAALCVILGYSEDALMATTFQELTWPDDRPTSYEMLRRMGAGEIDRFTMEKRYRHADGHAVWANLSVAIVRDERGEPLHLVTHVEDITDRRARTEALQDLALRDELTKLANRARFLTELAGACAHASPDSPVGVLFLDLDGFKRINDTHGHARGDDLLRLVGQRLEHAVRTRDLAARLGGDEFAVLLPPAAHPDDVSAVAARVLAVLGEPYLVDDAVMQLGASIGGAVATECSDAGDALLAAADAAMYEAKRRGKNTYVVDEDPSREG